MHVISTGIVHSPTAELLGNINGSGIIEINREFHQPIRPIIHIEARKDVTHPAQIFIHGIGETDAHRIEHIPANRIHWHLQSGYVSSDFTYTAIERIEVVGIHPEDSVIIQSANFTCMDQSLLIPLWAGVPSKDRAKILINLTVMNKKKFLSPCGIRPWIEQHGKNNYPKDHFGIHLPWTDLVLDGFIFYGERTKAAEVFKRIMKPVILSLKNDLTLHQSYHCETGTPFGAQNSIASLIPIGLFLRILGITIINSSKVIITDSNPFPWPITVKYQGLTVIKQEKKTLVIFSDGQNITVDNEQGKTISCEKPI
jgi:hypothetical protein